MITWGRVALGLVTLLAGIWKYLDDAKRDEVARKLAESEAGKRAEEYLQKARMVRDAIELLGADKLREPDQFQRR